MDSPFIKFRKKLGAIPTIIIIIIKKLQINFSSKEIEEDSLFPSTYLRHIFFTVLNI